MKFEVEDKIVKVVGAITAVGSMVVGALLFMDSRHEPAGIVAASQYRLQEEIVDTDSKIRQRILMSESTRYAEIAKYYYELQQERPLTLAELERLRLVEKQQERITETLLGTTN
jgi:hypothetical protein